MNNSRVKKIVIGVLVLTILIMSVAYANLYQELRIHGNASVIASWKVEITGIREGDKQGNAVSTTVPSYTSSTASFNANLSDINDSIEYIITIKNSGKIDAKLNSITKAVNGNDTITYEIIGATKDSILKSGDTIEVRVKVGVNPSITEITETVNSSSTIIFNYVQNI